MKDEVSSGVRATVAPGAGAGEVVEILTRIGVPAAIGPVNACDTCGFFSCVCAVRAAHTETCRFRVAMCSMVGIECEHGRDVCPTCDTCDCGAGRDAEDNS